MAGVFFGPFFLGTFYRSASLYHPQRRAIIHLKTQQKQILDRNPLKATKLKDLKSFKDKSIIFAMIASFLASFGIYTPFVSLVCVIDSLLRILGMTIIRPKKDLQKSRFNLLKVRNFWVPLTSL